VLLFIGFTGAAFNTNTAARVTVGDTISIRGYELTCEKIDEGETTNYAYMSPHFSIKKNGKDMGAAAPQKRFYAASDQRSSEVAIKSSLKEDLYVVFDGIDEDQRASVQVYVNPLVAWVWIGGVVLVLGTILALLPDARDANERRFRKALEQFFIKPS
jgi:cytochrome c-type biogenesis protein CcmF